MKYKYVLTEEPAEGKLVYSQDEYSFDTENQRAASEPVASIAIAKTLQVEFGIDSGTLLHIWGYSPREAWQKAEITPPNSMPGQVTIIDDEGEDFGAGFSYSELNLKNEKVLFDENSGWISIGSSDAKTAIEICKGIILGFSEDKLACVWLCPTFES